MSNYSGLNYVRHYTSTCHFYLIFMVAFTSFYHSTSVHVKSMQLYRRSKRTAVHFAPLSVSHTICTLTHMSSLKHCEIKSTWSPLKHCEIKSTWSPLKHCEIKSTWSPLKHCEIKSTWSPLKHCEIKSTWSPLKHCEIKSTWSPLNQKHMAAENPHMSDHYCMCSILVAEIISSISCNFYLIFKYCVHFIL